ncbi:MAG: hypothetical protein AAGG51_01980, partial [Cyanobacteria bacterium P01_G01_bin.54]
YFAARHATSELADEVNRKPQFLRSEVPGMKASQIREPDRIRPREGRTLDIKVGGRNLNGEQLDDYLNLIKQSQDPNNTALRNKLKGLGIGDGELKGHDYLFLPTQGSDIQETLSRAYFFIRRKDQTLRRVRIYYVDNAGDIWRYYEPGRTIKVGSELGI